MRKKFKLSRNFSINQTCTQYHKSKQLSYVACYKHFFMYSRLIDFIENVTVSDAISQEEKEILVNFCMNKLIKKKVTTNQIIKFLSKVESYQTRFIEIQLQLASNAKMIVNEYNVGEVEFCNKLKISIEDYDNFIKGGYNYTIEHMAILQSFYVEKSTEKARNEAIKNAEMSFVNIK